MGKEKRGRNEGKRKPQRRALRSGTKYIVVTDGTVTEKIYFMSLKEEIERKTEKKISLEIRTNIKPSHMIDECKSIMSLSPEYTQCWIVIDKDEVSGFDDLVKATESHDRIHVAWSSPCLEYWFMCYWNINGNYNTSQLCCHSFGREFTRRTGKDYNKSEKNLKSLYKILTGEAGSESRAIQKAKARHLDHLKNGIQKPSEMTPCTTMYLLIEELWSSAQ